MKTILQIALLAAAVSLLGACSSGNKAKGPVPPGAAPSSAPGGGGSGCGGAGGCGGGKGCGG